MSAGGIPGWYSVPWLVMAAVALGFGLDMAIVFGCLAIANIWTAAASLDRGRP